MNTPSVVYTNRKPGSASLLFKRLAARNGVLMRTKTVAENREIKEKVAELRPFPAGLADVPALCGDVPCAWIYPLDGCREDRVVLYLHGGSWAFGSAHTARAFGALVAEALGCRVLVADYRLAPEHPYPAPLDDAFAVYSWLLDNGWEAGQVALLGDSAGGNLCLGMLHRLRDCGLPLPACVACASPVTDLRRQSAIVSSGDNLIYTRFEDRELDIFSMYLAGQELREHPWVSPIMGDLSGLPPILIHAGGDGPLAADNLAFANKVAEAGSQVAIKIWREMFHDFTVVGRTLRESMESIGELSDFLADCLGLPRQERDRSVPRIRLSGQGKYRRHGEDRRPSHLFSAK